MTQMTQLGNHIFSLPDHRINKNNYSKSFPGFWMLSNSWLTSKDQDDNTVITLIDATVHGDVFAAGCLFFYYITRGLHPFEDADAESILINIKKRNVAGLNSIKLTLEIGQNFKSLNSSDFHLELDKKNFAYETIKKLIGDPPTDGTQLLQIAAQNFGDLLPR